MNPSLRLIATQGDPELALVHLLQWGDDPRSQVETVDSIDPRFPRHEKSCIIISTQLGCAVGCLMCDASGAFHGNLTADQILDQVRFVLRRRPELVNTAKLKVHFARMGEPAHNAAAVLEALEGLPGVLPAPGLLPALATVAPAGSADFLSSLGRIKDRLYSDGRFQLQLSLNSTDEQVRRRLMPTPQLPLDEVARLGGEFHRPGDRKVALNFALARGIPVEPDALAAAFPADRFMVKLTPVNPTERATAHGLDTVLSAESPEAAARLVERLRDGGFDVVVSIGEPEEIRIGSNCGQLVRAWKVAATA